MRKLFLLFPIVILLSLNIGTLIYVNSTFLETFFSRGEMAAVFVLGALASIFSFFAAPRLVNILGKEKFLSISLATTLLSNLLLMVAGSGLWAALAFISYSTFQALSYYCLDIFIEEASLYHHTGEMRGIYLTFVNGGIVMGPLLVALVAKGSALSPFYTTGAVVLSLSFLLSLFLLKGAKKLRPILEHSFWPPFRAWWEDRNIRAVTLARFLLSVFFAVMVIYTPLYLHEEIGFSWAELGIIFTVMLLPFVFFEWPAGELADHFWGEKEMMSIGFFLIGISLLIMPFLGKSLGGWMSLLFLSRVGASLVEIMTESYFFKKIKAHEIGFLSIFRLAAPASIVFGALIGTLSLYFFSFNKIFFVVAFVALWGLYESLYIKDTR